MSHVDPTPDPHPWGMQDEARIAELADAFEVRWTRRDWYDVLVASRAEKLP